MHTYFLRCLILGALLLGTYRPAAALSLPAIFADHMVLQQQDSVLIWGWGKPGENIRISTSWNRQTYQVKVPNQAHWLVKVKTPVAGGPYEIHFQGNNEIRLRDVMIGEVWLCSGQSNMEWSANMGIDQAEEEIAQAQYDNIRFFTASHRTASTPQIDLHGNWSVCTPQNMADFSALAYFFGRKLQGELKVPIGLINASWGGTPIEVWIPEGTIQADPFLAKTAALLNPIPWGPHEPGRAYNTLIAPLEKFRIAGALWYQGETNTRNPYGYQEMLHALIGAWRSHRGHIFPFYWVQIAPYEYGPEPRGAVVRDEQRQALNLGHTGMVVVSDIGDTTDIHPQNKQDVGLRLAHLALHAHYQVLDQEVYGPLYSRHEVAKGKVILHFDHAEGLVARGKTLTHFEIAGEDRIFYPAKAKIKGEQIEVSAHEVKSPVAVRFAFGNKSTPNLFNAAGLPASCFRTDDWPIEGIE